MSEETGRRITIGESQFIGKKGLYSSPSIEPPDCKYLRTYGEGRLRELEPAALDYDDFDLYENQATGAFCYRFWKRDYFEGKESGKSYYEPVAGFPTLDAVIEDALAVFKGEREEHISSELGEWRKMARWTAVAIMLEHQLREEPHRVGEIQRIVAKLREQVHPRARGAWSTLEWHLQQAPSLIADFDEARAHDGEHVRATIDEWRPAERWARKLRVEWSKLEEAPKQLVSAIQVYPHDEFGLLDDVHTALLSYLDVARRVQQARMRAQRRPAR